MLIVERTDLEELSNKFQGFGVNMPLSKFVELNFNTIKEFKRIHVPLKTLAKIISSGIGKNVSVSSLAVAISRLNPNTSKPNQVNFIIEKKISTRFVDNNAKLIFGTQKETARIIKGSTTKHEERLIDWRGLAPNENISSWILEYKDKLIAINLTGWRWKQISDAINEHLSLNPKISTNTLTSIISIANKKDLAFKQLNNSKGK